jgi:autotransporter-associated beta strand protein
LEQEKDNPAFSANKAGHRWMPTLILVPPSRTTMKIFARLPLALVYLCFVAAIGVSNSVRAGNATWDLDPGSGDWNTATNWTPTTVPNGSADTATFGLSNTRAISISVNTTVDRITFAPDANAFTITASPGFTLTISGVGITNTSGTTQHFMTAVDGAGNLGQIFFTNSATAGTSVIFTNNGSAANFAQGGETAFFNTSTAADGTFVNKGATGSRSGGGTTVFHDSSTAGNANFTNSAGVGTSTSATIFLNSSTAANGFFTNDGGGSVTGGTFKEGGQTIFFNTSTAANATFVNKGATASGGFGGATVFDDSSSAGNGTFTNNGGAASGVAALGGGATFFFGTSTAANGTFINNAAPASGAEGGVTEFGLDFFNFSPSAGSGTFTNNGATISGAVGGKTVFKNASTADAATLIANEGTNGGGGGAIFFEERSTGGTPQVEVFGNGFLDISGHLGHAGLTIGSIEGDGNGFLGSNNLTVGSNNVSTVFSGVLQDGGQNGGTGSSLTKIGSGTLTLSGTNTYTGAAIIKGGVLQVDGSITSNTFVDPSGSNRSATLAGTGIIHGSVTNNGTVRPGDGPGTLTVNSYTQMSGSTLLIDIAGPNTGQFSVLDVLGNANLNPNALLLPVLQNGFVPTVGESFIFMDCLALTGTFFIFDRNIDNAMEHWNVTYQSKDAILTVAPGNVTVPDRGSTVLLLTLSLLGLARVTKWRSRLSSQSLFIRSRQK